MKYAIFLLSFSLLVSSCIKDPEVQLENDIDKIEKYLDDKGLIALSTESGLHYIIEVEGTGGNPTINDDVTVFYKGYFLNEEVFDETSASPVTFPLANVIEGWQEGIPLFKKGGKGKLLIPSGLGYGLFPPPGIKKNAVLIFDIELVDF
jgi:FKBP-type peptidyl-prolyl cis-trans isomerase FkpA